MRRVPAFAEVSLPRPVLLLDFGRGGLQLREASMEPRSYDHGNLMDGALVSGQQMLLQWSHGLTTMETITAGAHASAA